MQIKDLGGQTDTTGTTRRLLLCLALLGPTVLWSPNAALATIIPASIDYDYSIEISASSAAFSGNGSHLIMQTTTGDLVARRLSDGVEWYLLNANPITELGAESVDTWGSSVVFSDSAGSKVWFPQEGTVRTLGPAHVDTGVGYFDRSPGYWVWDGSAFDFVNRYSFETVDVNIDYVPITLNGFSYLIELESPTEFSLFSLYDFTDKPQTDRCWFDCDITLAEFLGWASAREVPDDFLTHRFVYLLINKNLYTSNHVISIEPDRIDFYKRTGVWRGRAIHATSLEQLMHSWDYTAEDARVTRLYQAFFGRTPDLGGLQYWLEHYQNGVPLDEVAFWFSQSDEFQAAYAGTTNPEYVDRVYLNVLGRGYDQAGYDYWLGLLDSDQLDRAGVVTWVTANGEFISSYPYLP